MKKDPKGTLPTKPLDQTRLSELPEDGYEFQRPLYRCLTCASQGEHSKHKYVDECPYFEG